MSENVDDFHFPELDDQYLSDAIAMLWPEATAVDEPHSNPQPEPKLPDEEDDQIIKALLWPFYKNTEPKTLHDIGFDLNIPHQLMHLFVPSSIHPVHDLFGSYGFGPSSNEFGQLSPQMDVPVKKLPEMQQTTIGVLLKLDQGL
ncbi:ubiquitin carboxyl-terminal hydrolase family protein [Striga asiatica]|uniref:Ubiquitin carboxyl-terminal hydrolase family protein n=1 Tax=Striga asiatica TaxID=4170 RepID=A0A5A7Q6T7_STRAF|nr:ubiquitin carboxyl-terminal hydrolase family protein [Striga asiatica]